MASKREGLVADRVKMMENINLSINSGIPNPYTKVSYMMQAPEGKSNICSQPKSAHATENVKRPEPTGPRDHVSATWSRIRDHVSAAASRLKRPLNPAPAANQQPAGPAPSAPPAVANAESAVPLLSTASSRVRVLPTQNGGPCYIFPPPKSAHTTENVNSPEHTGPRVHVNATWSRIRDHVSAAALRFEKTDLTQQRKFALCLLFVACLIFLVFFMKIHTRDDTSNRIELDEYFYHLNYSSDELLVYQGDSISSFIPREGILNENQFIVIERKKNSLSNERTDIGVVSSNEHRTFPGSLVLANQRLMDNAPDLLAVDRAPLTYTINLPGLTDDGSFKIVPSFAEYESNRNKVLKIWFDKYSSDHSVVANFQNDISFAYSQDLLRFKFGLEFKDTLIESSVDFSEMTTQEKLIVIHRFKQILYTVSVEPTKKPSDLFGTKVTVNDLKQKTNNDNPPVIVDSVSYGRTVYVKIETSSTDKEAKMLLEMNIKELNNKDEVEISKKLKNLSLTVYVLGGASEQIELINARTIKEVNDVIIRYNNFSRANPGYPISYSSQFIKDNSRAVVHMATDYIETTRTIYSKGIIKIIHSGWFVMQWAISWKELNYDKNGNSFKVEKAWSKNYQDITAHFEHELELPGNAQDIHVFAREATGLIWEGWRTVIDRSSIPLIEMRTFSVWGTTLYPQYYISPPI